MNIKKYKKLLKKNKTFVIRLSSVKKINDELKINFNLGEVNQLVRVSKKYKINNLEPKVLMTYLQNTTGNRERLVEIQNFLEIYYNKIDIEIRGIKKILQEEEFFMSLKRQDRLLYLDSILSKFIDLESKVKTYLKVVENSITHLDKVQFNIKTIISYEKTNGV